MNVLTNILRRSGGLMRRSCNLNHDAILGVKNVKCSTTTTTTLERGNEDEISKDGLVKMSKSMQAYQERAKAHDKFMAEQVAEYEIGRRHLANMMGEDPETFTQEDIDEAISYLFPSGLFEPRARPLMKHPDEVFIKRKAVEFDISGRPFHTLFYTAQPSYYQALHDLSKTVSSLNQFANRLNKYQVQQDTDQSFNSGGSDWVSKEELENIFLEKIQDKQYAFFIRSMTLLIQHPYSSRAKDFIMRFRKIIAAAHKTEEIPKLLYTADGVPYMNGKGKKFHTPATATVFGQGTGKFTINGVKDLRYFENIQDREQIVFPLQFTDLLGKVDVVAEVEGGGPSGQSAAIRLAISRALQSFVDPQTRERMRIAGLLTQDPRRHERKKPGQKGARAKFTWKKR